MEKKSDAICPDCQVQWLFYWDQDTFIIKTGDGEDYDPIVKRTGYGGKIITEFYCSNCGRLNSRSILSSSGLRFTDFPEEWKDIDWEAENNMADC